MTSFLSPAPAPASFGGGFARPQPTPKGGATAPLKDRSRELLTALAAFQLRYNQPEEALAILQLVHRLWPRDAAALRLLTQAFVQIGDFEAASQTERAYLALQPAASKADRLRSAVISFGLGQLSRAYTTLMNAIAMGKGQ